MPSMAVTEHDTPHLRRTIELAERARGQTSPNPLVGAVVVKGGRVIGEGITQPPGEPHAERVALAACSEDPAGATMYVSLEPCCHHGRTPPCTDAIVEAGIARVVIASDDPTEKASGRGPGILRDEGVDVEWVDGEVAAAARLLNQPFRKHARTGRPLVVFKSAMTLDGKVATATGDSQWISGEASRARAHRWRAESDAVAVGIGTALADDPLLTARVEGVARQPRRVVFDSEARLPLASQLVQGAPRSRSSSSARAPPARTAVQALESAGVDVIVATGQNERARVGTRSTSSARATSSRCCSRAARTSPARSSTPARSTRPRVFVAPLMTGGRDAKTAVEGRASSGSPAPRALHVEVERIEDDVLVIARLKEW